MLSRTLANGTDLAVWADRIEARSVLARLILRLVYHDAHSQAKRIDFSSDEAIQLAGWDGVLEVKDGNEFIPSGLSGWEFGTNRDVKGKADSDYDKRKEDSLGLNPAETTFVFVTLRRWSGKDKWVRARKAEGLWLNVKAYDADDLATWLERAPGVHLWLSILIGKRPEGAMDVSSFWDDWADVTQPRMSADLVISGRLAEVERIISWLRSEPSSLTLQADSRQEAIAFFAGALERVSASEAEPFLSRAIVVEDVASWRHLAAAGQSLILIPSFDDREFVARAIKQGHQVLIPIGRDEPSSSATVTISRLKRHDAKTALVDMGFRNEVADELATLARRSMMALRRKLAIIPEVQRPVWAKPAEAVTLLPAMLVGGWNDILPGDRDVIARLARKPYEDVNDMLARAANEPDPPVRRVGDVWLIASKEDCWALLGKYLTRDGLENLECVVLDVLGQPDPSFDLPADERHLANILGKSLPYSGLLREGLAETLALMGAHGDSLRFADASTGEERADRIVGKLFHKASSDWRVWASISYFLPLLAEAAPIIFLDAVETGLSGEEPLLLNMFSEGENSLFSSSPHPGLLWALERMAWHDEYLGKAASLLAKLARLDPGGKLTNRPSSSLHEIFLCWNPQTTADLDKRLLVLDSIRERQPQVAWRLLNSLLPKALGGVSLPTTKPQWREWALETSRQVTYAELFQAEREIVSRLLADAGTDGQRWKDLVFKLDDVSKEQHDVIVEALRTVNVASFAAEEKMRIWESLQNIISKHRVFADAKWAMPKEMVENLQEVYERFAPQDPIDQRAWLFSKTPHLLNPPGRDWRAKHDALESARLEAVNALHAKGGLTLLLNFADVVERPMEAGLIVGKSELLQNEEDEFLGRILTSVATGEALFARGFVTGRFSSGGWDWVNDMLAADATSAWLPEVKAEFLASLSFEARTWDLLDAMDTATQQLYWSRVIPYGLPSRDDSERAAVKLIENGRPHGAIDFIALHSDEEGPAVSPSVVAGALERLLEVLPETAVDLSTIGYDITRLLGGLGVSAKVDESRIASLEWAYLPVIQNYGTPKLLHRELSRNPAFFVEVISLIYKSDEDEEHRERSQHDSVRAQLGHELIESWRQGPGCEDDGTVNAEAVSNWVKQARALLSKGRHDIGDYAIGSALANLSHNPDSSWPHRSVCDLIEELESPRLESGLETSVYNRRGVYTKSLTAGGEQERDLAGQYQRYANQLKERWPRTSSMLERVAQRYIRDAKREDVNGELTQDLWK